MKIATVCFEDISIRKCFIRKVYGIYVIGDANSPRKIQNHRKKIWEELRKDILKKYIKGNMNNLYPDVEKETSYRFVLRKPGHEHWLGLCPYASKKDVPFDHGCQLWDKEFGMSRYQQNVQYSFVLLGKNNCKKLEECAINLANKLGMGPEINHLSGNGRICAKAVISMAIEDIKDLYTSW